jgi:hypothetical protein
LAQTPLQVGIGLFAIGAFAAIYHPVGLAMVTQKGKNTAIFVLVSCLPRRLPAAGVATA